MKDDGNKMDVDKIIEAALQLGKLDTIEWEIEGEPEIQLHPVQNAPDTNHSMSRVQPQSFQR